MLSGTAVTLNIYESEVSFNSAPHGGQIYDKSGGSIRITNSILEMHIADADVLLDDDIKMPGVGRVMINDTVVSCPRGSRIMNKTTGLHTLQFTPQPVSFIQQRFPIHYKCVACPQKTYSMQQVYHTMQIGITGKGGAVLTGSPIECLDCPSHGVCLGGPQVLPESQYSVLGRNQFDHRIEFLQVPYWLLQSEQPGQFWLCGV